ncbi:MAG: CHAT domain-containing protein [Pirellulaceae bacterium]|nr:CHAT domain-containing protein [Pirellulaceae bacterium]
MFSICFVDVGRMIVADDMQTFMQLFEKLIAAEAKQDYVEALRLGEHILKFVNGSATQRGSISECLVLCKVGQINFDLGNLSIAEKQMRRALDLAEKLPPNAVMIPLDVLTTPLLMGLTKVYEASGLLTESVAFGQRALSTTEKPGSPAAEFRPVCLRLLGDAFSSLGRFAEAEYFHKQAAELARQNPSSYDFVGLFSLANDALNQGRTDEALSLTLQAYDQAVKAGEKETVTGLAGLERLTSAYVALSRYGDAARTANELLVLAARLGVRGQPFSLSARQALISIKTAKGQTDGLEQQWKDLIKEARSPQTLNHNVAINAELELAVMLHGQMRFQEANAVIEPAIRSLENLQHERIELALFYLLNGMIETEINHSLEAAQSSYQRAIDIFHSLRKNADGDPYRVAQSFDQFAPLFDLLLFSQAALGNSERMFETLELVRLRGLLAEMRSRGVNQFAGIPPAVAEPLRTRQREALVRLTELNQRLAAIDADNSKSADQLQRTKDELENQVRKSQAEVVAVRRDIFAAGRMNRVIPLGDQSIVPLKELQNYIAERRALLLQYVVSPLGAIVVVIGPQGDPTILALDVSDEQKKLLQLQEPPRHAQFPNQTPATTLTSDSLRSLLAPASSSGLLNQLRQPSLLSKDSQTKLRVLADVLFPGEIRSVIQSEKLKELIIVPDGALSLLPFEVLVLEEGDDPKYLLDVTADIHYAPSSTVLWKLLHQSTNSSGSAKASVLSLGGAVYGVSSSNSFVAPKSMDTRTRFATGRQKLNALPHSGQESKWVSQVFREKGLSVESLEKQTATEATVRQKTPGRTIVHFACHGLVDDKLGNRFGALAVTPGPKAGTDSLDDGYLTLAEICELNLGGCELAILSACESNYGPLQTNEGVWAMSRGFLVAGSRRVVAANWIVDDDACASLVSFFTAGVAQNWSKPEGPNYAKLLHDAKRWVRKQDKWKSPFYWGSIVLVGPG